MFWAHGFMQCPFAMIWAHELNFPAEETAIKSKKVMTQLETMVCGGDGDDLSAARCQQQSSAATVGCRISKSRIREWTKQSNSDSIMYKCMRTSLGAKWKRSATQDRNAKPRKCCDSMGIATPTCRTMGRCSSTGRRTVHGPRGVQAVDRRTARRDLRPCTYLRDAYRGGKTSQFVTLRGAHGTRCRPTAMPRTARAPR